MEHMAKTVSVKCGCGCDIQAAAAAAAVISRCDMTSIGGQRE